MLEILYNMFRGKENEKSFNSTVNYFDFHHDGLYCKKDAITAEQALNAVKSYCYQTNPGLEEMIKSDNYTINWEIQSSDDKEIVILYRSYTSALVRYYIDSVTGDTYVTEFMPGITDKEQKTDEHFNIKDYLSK